MVREKSKFKILSDDYIKHLFIDGYRVAQPNSNIFKTFENTEPGYFKGCICAFDYALGIEQKITVDDIIKIHGLSVEGVKLTNYENELEYDYITKDDQVMISKEIRNFTALYSMTRGVNCTVNGLNEIKKRWKTVNYFKWSINSHANGYNSLMIQHVEEWKATNVGVVDLEGEKYKEKYFCFISFPKDIKINNLQDKDLIKTFIQNALENYYSKILDGNNEDEKLFIICETIIKLEQLHPFSDANCRTFCMVLLNKLLLDNGFFPALQQNPNKFEGYSTQEMVEEIKKSILKTELFESSTDKDIFLMEMYLLDSKDKSISPDPTSLQGIVSDSMNKKYNFSIDEFLEELSLSKELTKEELAEILNSINK
jgi:hypothetical protein